MTRFRIGQRVRLIDSWDDQGQEVGQKIAGREAIIVAIVDRWYVQECDLDIQCYDVDVDGVPYVPGYVREDWLIPLADPGREVVSWSECAWQPEHLRSPA